MFKLKENEFFQGELTNSRTNESFVVVHRGTRGATVRMVLKEAKKRNWDYVIRLCQENVETGKVGLVQEWINELPPEKR